MLTCLRQWPARVGEGAGRLEWHVVGWVEGTRGVHESAGGIAVQGEGEPEWVAGEGEGRHSGEEQKLGYD